jgi:hypothetical protein
MVGASRVPGWCACWSTDAGLEVGLGANLGLLLPKREVDSGIPSPNETRPDTIKTGRLQSLVEAAKEQEMAIVAGRK